MQELELTVATKVLLIHPSPAAPLLLLLLGNTSPLVTSVLIERRGRIVRVNVEHKKTKYER